MTAVDRASRPAAGAPHPLRLPSFDAVGLPNGLSIELAERPGVPEVSLRLVLETGAAAEPAARGGLAELASRLLTEGTADRDAVTMARWLDRLGATYQASTGYAVGVISMHLVSDVLDAALEFLATTVREAAFPEREVERVRGERIDEIERERDEPAVVANLALIEALYGDALYGRPVAGTLDTVGGLDAETVRAFHASRFGARGAVLFACGDFRRDELLGSVERHFGTWTGASETVGPPQASEPPAPEVILIDRPGSPQAEVRVGTIGLPYGTGDHHAVILANAILGGLFNSRINMNLREDKGWTYGARTAFRFRRGAGPFTARTAVETGVTAAAFGEILSEIERMREELVSAEELALARNALTLSLPLQFETPAQITRKVSHQRIYGLPDDYWEVYRSRIEAVTAEQIRDVCRRYLAPGRLTLLAVTDAAAVGDGLDRFGTVDRRPGA